MPSAFHVYCLYHLRSNVDQHLRIALGTEWAAFQDDFWNVYRAVSPQHFDELWNNLIDKYPEGRDYLQNELYDCRSHWAWAWVGVTYTCAVKTNGRAESENRIIKMLTRAKGQLRDTFTILNSRKDDQRENELILTRQVSTFRVKPLPLYTDQFLRCLHAVTTRASSQPSMANR